MICEPSLHLVRIIHFISFVRICVVAFLFVNVNNTRLETDEAMKYEIPTFRILYPEQTLSCRYIEISTLSLSASATNNGIINSNAVVIITLCTHTHTVHCECDQTASINGYTQWHCERKNLSLCIFLSKQTVHRIYTIRVQQQCIRRHIDILGCVCAWAWARPLVADAMRSDTDRQSMARAEYE